MTQTRYFLRAGRALAERVYDAWDETFSEEGAPVGILEVDEAADIHEASVYFDDEAGGAERGPEVSAAIEGLGAPPVEREQLPDIDWMKNVLADLKPVRAGRFVVHGAHDRENVRLNELSIEIEAGQAFGTGHHGTTAGCLEMIDALVRRRRPRNALDLGTGTAVLAIALAKLARCPVLATDIDPVAVAVAAENVAANEVAAHVTTAVAAGLSSDVIRRRAPFDLVVANILAGPLMRLAPAVARSLAPGGDLVLSGILAHQRRSVLAAYRIQGIFHRGTFHRGEWVTLHLSR